MKRHATTRHVGDYRLAACCAIAWIAVGLSGCPAKNQETPPAADKPAQETPHQPAAKTSADAARKVVQAMVAVYQQASTYQDHATLRMEFSMDGQSKNDQVPFAVALMRPNKVRVEAYQVLVTCDGQRLRAKVDDVPGQVLDKDSPAKLAVKSIHCDPVLVEALRGGVAGLPPQVLFLLGSDPLKSLLSKSSEIELNSPAPLGDRTCDRVKVKQPDGLMTLWIDQQDHLLRRIEYPVDRLSEMMSQRGEVKSLTVTADFTDARLGGEPEAAGFKLETPPGTELVKYFLPPSADMLLGKKAPDFKVLNLKGESIGPAALAGKITVLDFWATWCGPCRESLPHLEALRAKFKDNAKLAFLAVSVDDDKVANDKLVAMMKDLKVEIPVARDGGPAQRSLMIDGYPTTVILSADGVVQDYLIGGGPENLAKISGDLDQLLQGKDISAEAVKQYQERMNQYRDKVRQFLADQEKSTDVETIGLPAEPAADAPQSDNVPVPRAQLAPQSTPQTVKLKSLWKATLKDPGYILVIQEKDKPPRILVVDEYRRLVELAPDGTVSATVDLASLPPADEGQKGKDKDAKPAVPEPVAFVRTAVTAAGQRYFLTSGAGLQQVHLFDEHWKPLQDFPKDALENRHAGITDAVLADLDGDGKLKMYVAYMSSVGVQGVALDGQRIWSNRALGAVFSLAVVPDAEGHRTLLCAYGQSTLALLDVKGETARQINVGTQPIQVLATADFGGDGRLWLCGLAARKLGAFTAVGFNLQGEELWHYDLPEGVHERPIEPIVAGRLSASGPGNWVLPGADGSIHILSADGKPIDHFNYGARLQGLATATINNRPVLLVSTAAGVEAWEVQP